MKNILNAWAKQHNKSRKQQHEPTLATTICWRSAKKNREGLSYEKEKNKPCSLH